MAPDQAAPVPAGWYPDPYAVSELRWWDGQNWTDSVHPPIAPEPVAPEPVAPPVVAPQPAASPVASEPVVAAPVAVEPVVPEPAAPESIVPAQTAPEPAAPEQAPASLDFPPPAMPTPEPAPLVEPAPGDGLPSRRELRARTAAAGEGSGPAGASGGTAETPPRATVPDSSTPSSFDWLPGGAALGTGAAVSTAAASAPTPPSPAPAAPEPAVVASAPPAQADPTSAPADPTTSAWAQEPAVATAAADELYSNAATRTSTVSGWFIALMPLFAGILSIAAVKGAENYPRYIPATLEWWMLAGGVVVVLYLVTILLAVADRSKLDWAGYTRPAHWAWSILTAPVYLLVRTIAVKRETGRNSALLWVWLVLAAALVGAWFAVNYFMPELLAPYPLPFL